MLIFLVFRLTFVSSTPLSTCSIDLLMLVLYRFYTKYCLPNKAIRDGKYLAPPHASAWQVHPIKIENFDMFSWRHFTARSSFYIINWYGYTRGSHEKYLKEIVSPVFEIRTPLNCYMLNVAHVTNDVKWRPIVTTFGTLIENMSRTGLYDCHIF